MTSPTSVRRLGARIGAGLGALLATVLSMVAFASPAGAHPLGNFTVNRYARVEISAGVVRIYYVLDEAEIPTFQEGAAPKTDPIGFAAARTADLAAHLRLSVDNNVLPLTASVPEMSLPPGQAGLRTLHLSVLFSAPLSGTATDPHTLDFVDSNQPDHIGWREIVVTARGDAHIKSSNAPDHDVSRELTAYPGNLIQSPLDLRRATATFTAGSQTVTPTPFIVSSRSVVRSGAGFAALINHKKITVLVLLGLLVVAAGFGAVHALAPGHGKTIMAAYLVGTRGRPRDAVLLGTIVSVMHTASVLALGGALYAISRNANPDRVYPYLKIASGAGIAGWGAWLIVQRTRILRRHRVGIDPDPLEVDGHLLAHAHAGHRHATENAPQHAHAGHEGHGPDHDHEAPDADHHHDHDHDHDEHDHHDHDEHDHHDHDEHDRHDHGHEPHPESEGHVHGPGGHTHELPEGVAPLSRRGLILLATGGGLFPSPSAVLVLISAFELHRTGLGLALIAAFSIGLAVTLTLVGLALVYGRRVVDRRRGFLPAIRLLPVASAAAITILGLAFAINGVTGVR